MTEVPGDVVLLPESEHAEKRLENAIQEKQQLRVQRWVAIVAVIFVAIVSLAAGAAGHKIVHDRYFQHAPVTNYTQLFQMGQPIHECGVCATAISAFINATSAGQSG